LIDQKVKWGMNFFLSKMIAHAPTHINHHPMMGVYWMVTKMFWLPKKGVAHVISFLKKKKHSPMSSWATKKLQSPFDGGGVPDGNQIFSVSSKGGMP
jgi:hypothetical protein